MPIAQDLHTLISQAPTKRAWDKIGLYPHHGINVPLFSIHSEKSCGIGEFLDLLPLIDWVHSFGFDLIQLLPLNDTGEEHSPYNALSSCALNPIYLSLHALPYLNTALEESLLSFHKYRALDRIPYTSIYEAKFAFLRLYFEEAFPRFEHDPAYQTFLLSTEWAKPYALYKTLKEKHLLHEHLDLPSHLYATYEKEMHFFLLLQFLAIHQMKEVKEYARQKGVFLKGDIPILISPDALDTLIHPTDFDFSRVAGAPPDVFAPDGQLWGFPLYNWDSLEKNHFHFWERRLKTASQFYDIYRIDHIIGLYRIWAIEKGRKAIEGHYMPSDPAQMILQGEKLLTLFSSMTNMLPIGEDLGTHIDAIRASFTHLGIPGTKIPRWERYYGGDLSFIPYEAYSPISMTSLSTHDSELLGEWWENYPTDAKEFAKFSGIPYEAKLSFASRFEILKQSHKTPSLFHINLLQEYLSLFPDLSPPLAKQERINSPGRILLSNWSYKTKVPLEALSSHPPLNKALELLRSSID